MASSPPGMSRKAACSGSIIAPAASASAISISSARSRATTKRSPTNMSSARRSGTSRRPHGRAAPSARRRKPAGATGARLTRRPTPPRGRIGGRPSVCARARYDLRAGVRGRPRGDRRLADFRARTVRPRSRRSRRAAEFPDRRAVLITLRRPGSGEPLDRALITRFMAPRSFTGEEMAEVSVTGGRAVTAAVVEGAGPHSRTAPCRTGRIRLARVRQWQDRSFGSRRARRPGRGGDRGAAAAGPAHRRRRAEPRVRGDPRRPHRGDGGCRSADRFFRRRGCGGFDAGFGQARGAGGDRANRPGARDRRRRANACARASPSSSPGLPMSASRR